ncbi:MAG: type II toxin-antitoxin system HipA family toxin [Sulfurospirillum sp.]
MSINRIQKDILRVLIEEKTYINLNDIILKLSSHKLTTRTFQKHIKPLVETNRIDISGKASSTKYIISEIQSSYPSSEFLYVYKDNIIIGQFFKIKGIYRFYYDSEYLSLYNEAIPTLELGVNPYDFEEIPAIFEDNIPEGINKELIEIKYKEADEFEILNLMDDSIGDLCFSKSKESCYIEGKKAHGFLSSLDEILSTNPKINILEGFSIDLSDAGLFLENEDLSSLKNVRAEGISGFQYKKFVNIDFNKKQILSNEKNSQYILKPYSKIKADPKSDHYFPHMALNEHLHLSFAKNELGFRVPYSALIKRDGDEEYHYIVKRFDRLGGKRFAKASFAAYMGLRSENKYSTTSEKMFKRIERELISPKEKMELLKHYVYSVIIVHEDLHAKNLSLIYDNNKVLFAPLYDVCSTAFYGNGYGYESHLTINGKRNNIRPNDFKNICKILNIPFKEFKKEAANIAKAYIEKMPLYFAQIRKIGYIPYSIKKQATKRGESSSVYMKIVEEKNFVDILEKNHTQRIESLKELGWC